MAKQTTDPASTKRKLLNDLKVKRAIEKTDKYDNEITKIQSELDFFDFGIK